MLPLGVYTIKGVEDAVNYHDVRCRTRGQSPYEERNRHSREVSHLQTPKPMQLPAEFFQTEPFEAGQ